MRTYATIALVIGMLLSSWGPACAQPEKWVFIQGKLKGRVIVADPATHAVSPADNPLSQASGTVAVGSFRDCNGLAHFHGTWAGRKDPAPKRCGWGRLARSADSDPGGALLGSYAVVGTVLDVLSDRFRRSTLGCSADQVTSDLASGQEALDDAASTVGELQGFSSVPLRLVAALNRCLNRLRGEYLKLGRLLTDFLTTPPADETAMDKFCTAYKKRLKRIRHAGRCLVTAWVKAFGAL